MISWMFPAVARMPLTGKVTATEYHDTALSCVVSTCVVVLAKGAANLEAVISDWTCDSVTCLSLCIVLSVQ
jgi:hypothetical protein